MVLLSETKNGYPHYLLAVGHLHEAEEEAQAWPVLATVIRTARKELQTTGTVPDWEGIMGMMERVKDSGFVFYPPENRMTINTTEMDPQRAAKLRYTLAMFIRRPYILLANNTDTGYYTNRSVY